MDSMFSIFNLGAASQAGRRGFESRLPLHLFNSLEIPTEISLLLVSAESTEPPRRSSLLSQLLFEFPDRLGLLVEVDLRVLIDADVNAMSPLVSGNFGIDAGL